MDALLHTGKHLRGAHRHVVHDHITVIQFGVAQQQVGHQIDDVPAGEVRSGLLAKGLGKALDEILKYIATVHGADLIRTEVAFGGVELLDDQIQAVALHHTADDVVKIELGQHILHIAGEPGQLVPEICFDVVRVGQQALKSKPAGVIELIAGSTGQKAVDNRQLLNLFILLDHRIVGGQQAVV